MSKLQTRAFSMLAALLMIVSLFAPAVSAQSTKSNTTSKLSADLVQQFESNDKATFIVTLNEKADTVKVAKQAREKAEKASLSSEKVKLAQREAVISELKATAKSTQANVVKLLEKKNVEFTTHHITNAVVVTATEDVAKELAALPEVKKVIPNLQIKAIEPVAEPTDAKLASSVLDNVDLVNPVPLWEEGITGEGIVIGSLDSGAQWDHPALKEAYRGYNAEDGTVNHEGNFFDPIDGIEEAYDDDGHGTHTIGTMTGYVADEDTIIGVAPGAKWISGKILDAAGNGNTNDLLEAAEWMMAPGGDASLAPDVINNSWGFPGADPIEDLGEFFRDVIVSWNAAGIAASFAAGNQVEGVVEPVPGSVSAPAAYPEAFAVGAIYNNKDLAEFSLRGPSPYDETKPEVVAQGVDVVSAYPGDGYVAMPGTSMAAPAVAGAIALLLQAAPDAEIADIEQALLDTAEALTDAEYPQSPNDGFGHGLINVSAAAEELVEEPEEPEEPVVEIDRIEGADRYDTAIQISQKGWEDGALEGKQVVLARGDDFADALAGVPLAHALNSPILLVPTSTDKDAHKRVLENTMAEVERLGANDAILLGGEIAVDPDVDNQLNNENIDTERLAGETRFDTAVEIAEWLVENVEGFSANEVALANGLDFPDALSIASSAAQSGTPILLTQANKIPDATQAALEDLNVESTAVIGGPAVVSEDVFGQLPGAKRLAGKDRFDTNFEILRDYNVDADHLYVATGMEYADALTGAVLAAKENTAVILVNETTMKYNRITEFLTEQGASDLSVFGGSNAVSDSIVKSLEDFLNQ